MTRTTEKLLTWGSLGLGLALIFMGHKRIGFIVGLVSPATAIARHPRQTRRALRLVPKAVAKAGKQVGINVTRATKATGKGVGWLAG